MQFGQFHIHVSYRFLPFAIIACQVICLLRPVSYIHPVTKGYYSASIIFVNDIPGILGKGVKVIIGVRLMIIYSVHTHPQYKLCDGFVN